MEMMELEIYILNLLKASGRARSSIQELRSSLVSMSDSSELLRYLCQDSNLDSLAYDLNSAREGVFKVLSHHIANQINSKHPLGFEDDRHFLILTKSRQSLSYVLDCDSDEALDRLFDVRTIWDMTFDIDFKESCNILKSNIDKDILLPSVETMLYKSLGVYKRAHGKLSVSRLIDESHWLQSRAADKLRTHALSQGFICRTDSELLITAIDSDCKRYSEKEVGLDSLAIIHVQQRIEKILHELLSEAKDYINNSVAYSPSNSILIYLKIYIELYSLQAPARAWRSFLLAMEKECGSKGRAILNALNDSPEMIQCLTLLGVNVPFPIHSSWTNGLNDQPAYVVEPNKDTEYPVSRDEIANRLLKQHGNAELIQ